MYYTAAGGVAGGVVVGYLASDSALGLRSLIRLCRGLGVFDCVSCCCSTELILLIQYLLFDKSFSGLVATG